MNQIKTSHRAVASAVLLGSIALSCSSAHAAYDGNALRDDYNPSWYLMPSINGIDPDNRFGTDRRGEGVGIRLGKPVAPSWDIQFGPTFSRVRDGEGRYRQNTFGIDALYLFSRGRFGPFILVGAGAEMDKVSQSGVQVDRTSPYVNAGVGMQYAFGHQWGMQADVRRAHSYLRGDEFNFNRANTTVLTVGLTYAFDKAVRRTPVARTEYLPAPAIPSPVAVVIPPPAPRFERYTLSSTELFGFDSSALNLPQAKLDEIADVLIRNPQLGPITISGYTDRLGSDNYNQKLSQQRADAVKTYLTNKGVDPARLLTVAMGEQHPEVDCTDTNRADLIRCLEPNRRVESEQMVIERLVR
ncbi:OmpA family protein [Chitinimonas naiadis]